MSKEKNPIPQHVAIIMDGNGRWATQRGLPRLAGHKAGTENLRRVIRAAANLGIKYISFYAFSTENWNRPKAEVEGLLRLLSEFIDNETEALNREGARLLHLGHLAGLGPMLESKVKKAIELTKDNQAVTVLFAFNYGGRDEIVTAVKRLIAEGVTTDEVTIEKMSSAMFTAGIPDPELVIRTSGEQRTSNFLTWQTVYSEWAFPKTLWPDFDGQILSEIIDNYRQRDRRFGGLSKS
jgi:undecaprenyl diphosphate synthase